MSAKPCKAGHYFASYLAQCPFCVPLPKIVKPLMARRVTKRNAETVTERNAQHCPTCRCGPALSNAARQRAYRQRRSV